MISNAPYGAEPWRLTEAHVDLDMLAQSESVFALSNGHIGLRGNLDEGEPYGLPGTYLNSLYEVRPLPYAEAGYGFPDEGQTVINVTNGKVIRLLVNDEPFDIRYGSVQSHTRTLDLRAGTLTRTVVWTSPAGHTRPGRIGAAGVADPARGRRDQVHGQAGGRDPAPGRALGDRGQRGSAGHHHRPARRRRAVVAAGQRGTPGVRRQAPARRPRPQHPDEQAADGLRDGARRQGPEADDDGDRVVPRPRPADGRRPGQGGRGAQPRKVPRLRVVVAAVAARAGRPGPRRARRGPADRLGRAAQGAAGVPGLVLGGRRRRSRR